jgi:hypothetical protein
MQQMIPLVLELAPLDFENASVTNALFPELIFYIKQNIYIT